MSKRGLLLVISGPSGVGKSALGKLLLERNTGICYSVSATTRPPRLQEVEGESYFFFSTEEFVRLRDKGGFLEWAEVYGNYYGTPKEAVEKLLSAGRDVVLEIDTQGAAQVKQICPEGILIFIMPPSAEELKHRITKRGSETEESLNRRLAAAASEMELAAEYDHIVVNHTLAAAVKEVEAIIANEHRKNN